MTPNIERPAAGANRSGPSTVFSLAAQHTEDSQKRFHPQQAMTFRSRPDSKPVFLDGLTPLAEIIPSVIANIATAMLDWRGLA